MARLHDSSGKLLGGFHSSRSGATPQATAVSVTAPSYVPPQPLTPYLNRRFAPEETIPGLLCSYGTFAYAFADTSLGSQAAAQQSPKRGCHVAIETPRERHHCDDCGGDYCLVHATPLAHDCKYVIQPQR